MTPIDLARAVLDAPDPDARIAALEALCAAVREGLGYRLPDGTVARRWREASRAWLAVAAGREPGQPGRTASGRTLVALGLRVAPDVAAWLRAQAAGPSATIERLVHEAQARRLTAAATPPAPPARPPER